jgi:SAM-dependent methyltransferase
MVDVGCGNGKYLVTANSSRVLGVGFDRSAPLVSIAASRGYEAAVGDALCVPIRSGAADAALLIAVMHHLSTKERRLAALVELLRLIRPRGGQALVYAWALEQGSGSRRAFATQDVLVPWALKRHFVDAEMPLPPGAVVDAERDVIVLQRFCHVYTKGELESLFEEAAKAIGARFEPMTTCELELLANENKNGDAIAAHVSAVGQESASYSTLCGSGDSVVRVRASWYEADNHCVLIQRC